MVPRSKVKLARGRLWNDLPPLTTILRLSRARYKAVWWTFGSSWTSSMKTISLVAGSQQQGVQVGDASDGLPQRLVGLHGQFMPEDGGDLGLAQARRTDEKGIVQPPVVLEAGSEGYTSWSTDRLLPDDVGERGGRCVVQVVGHRGSPAIPCSYTA